MITWLTFFYDKLLRFWYEDTTTIFISIHVMNVYSSCTSFFENTSQNTDWRWLIYTSDILSKNIISSHKCVKSVVYDSISLIDPYHIKNWISLKMDFDVLTNWSLFTTVELYRTQNLILDDRSEIFSGRRSKRTAREWQGTCDKWSFVETCCFEQ